VSEKHRSIVCMLSVILAYGGVAVSGAWEPATKLLHRWSLGVLVAFLLIFLALMFLTLRGKLAKSLWAIPVSAALGYPAATIAYLVYFLVFEPQRTLNTLTHGQLLDVVVMLLILGPTISFAWLFGAVEGAAFFLLGRTLQTD
jgi:peptidoglycan/LPS O-acetylase OafA/YrhL